MTKLPQGSYVILTGEFLERFSFWGLQSLIVLYLINILHYSNQESVITQAVVTSLSFLFSIVGGLLADRFMGAYFSVKLGALFTILGDLTLALFDHPQITLFGLSSLALGAGLFMPNNPNILSTLYKEGSNHREYGFTFLYLCTNLGGTLAPFVYGLMAKYHHWKACFYLSAISVMIWYFGFLVQSRHLKTKIPEKQKNKATPFMLIISVISLLLAAYFFMNQPPLAGWAVALMLLLTSIYVIFQLKGHEKIVWQTVACAFLMIFACMWFFATEFQVNNSFLLFLEHLVNKQAGTFEIPVPFFASLEPLFVILIAPILARLWLLIKNEEFSASLSKITVGLFLECLGFYWMSYVAFLAMKNNAGIPFLWLMPVYFLLGAGELCVMPITISTITRTIPEKLKGTLLGLLYLSLSSSAYLSGFIATVAVKPDGQEGANYYQSYLNVAHFSLLVVLTFGIFLLISCSLKVRIWKRGG